MPRNGKTVVEVVSNAGAITDHAWDMVKARLAHVKFKEITWPGVSVRGDSTYNVYRIDETVLFATDTANRKPSAGET